MYRLERPVGAVCVIQWVLAGRGGRRLWRLEGEMEGGRPGLGGQGWCYVVRLLSPHVASAA